MTGTTTITFDITVEQGQYFRKDVHRNVYVWPRQGKDRMSIVHSRPAACQ